jgi:hypothetical protein
MDGIIRWGCNMGIAYKCDVTGVYADSLDRVRSQDFPITYQEKTFRIKATIEVLDSNGDALYLADSVWTQVINALKARI